MNTLRWGWALGLEGELKMEDYLIYDLRVFNEGDDPHLASTARAQQRVCLVDFSYHLCPAAARDPRAFRLYEQELARRPRLAHLTPMSIGVEAEVADSDLTLVGDMRGDPGDKFQVIHLLCLSSLFPEPVGEPIFFLIEGKTLQGKQRPDHVFRDPLFCFFLCLRPDLAVDREPRMPPGKNTLGPLRA